MQNNETSCGAVEVLNKLRKSQESSDPEKKVSRLEKYINQNKAKKENKLSVNNEHVNIDTIYEIETSKIIRWSEKDRPENELGNIQDLAESFKLVGQQVPCIIRPNKNKKGSYELIVGECRWRAAELAGLKLKVIIQNIDDRLASLIQAVENEKRNDISEYAKGMSYANKIKKGILSQKDLVDILGISKQQVSRLLSFNKIPKTLSEAIEDFRNVSARTAEEISRLSAKGQKHIDILTKLAPRIRTGKFGSKKIINAIDKAFSENKETCKYEEKITGENDMHIFTWNNNKNQLGIKFPKEIIKILNENNAELETIKREVQECVTKRINNLLN